MAGMKTCISVELIWDTRCEKAPGHERAEKAEDRIHQGWKAEGDRLYWGEDADMREVFR